MLTGQLHAMSILNGPSIYNLLTNNISGSDQALVFEQSGGNMTGIVSVRIYFLASDDCQSGYAGFYDTMQQGGVFPIQLKRHFGLNAAAVYQAGVFALSMDRIESAHSILVRFVGDSGHFTQFTGSCNDQGINCCLPVDCSNQIGRCLAKHELGIQSFVEYIPPPRNNWK